MHLYEPVWDITQMNDRDSVHRLEVSCLPTHIKAKDFATAVALASKWQSSIVKLVRFEENVIHNVKIESEKEAE